MTNISRSEQRGGLKSSLLSVLIVLGSCFGTFAHSEPGAKRLPIAVVKRVCEKYAGASAFVREGKVTKITCPYVDKLAVIDGPTLVESYRGLLASAVTLTGLRQSRDLPADLSCGDFQERKQEAERVIECTSVLAGHPTPFIFVADESGRLLRFETAFDFARIYRSTMEAAVERGSVSEFYDPYVSLQTDLLVEKLHFTAHESDSVLSANGKVSVVVRVQPR